ncbi:hypothetical protein G3I71_21690 [Streptomyces sp. SID12501]|uniref:Condensation domain-containing protein n=1 Tax=Streptomyces sp. SID12501 TaxID=2706042 RepID=A0A6B3BVL5_9ACTN|nr:hypothetical protein [Streptomyces sp. SID12501]
MRWSPELSRSATELARREGGTPSMVLLAGFDVLMAHSSGQRDITVGTPVAGRTMTELQPLVGFFANTLALRVGVSVAVRSGPDRDGQQLISESSRIHRSGRFQSSTTVNTSFNVLTTASGIASRVPNSCSGMLLCGTRMVRIPAC